MKISGCKHVISYRNQNLNSPKFLGTKLTKIKIWPVLYQIPYVRMHMLYVPELCWWRKVVAVCKGYLGDGQGRWHWPHEGRKRPLQLHWAHPRHIHFHLEWIHHQPEKSERTIYLSLKKKKKKLQLYILMMEKYLWCNNISSLTPYPFPKLHIQFINN